MVVLVGFSVKCHSASLKWNTSSIDLYNIIMATQKNYSISITHSIMSMQLFCASRHRKRPHSMLYSIEHNECQRNGFLRSRYVELGQYVGDFILVLYMCLQPNHFNQNQGANRLIAITHLQCHHEHAINIQVRCRNVIGSQGISPCSRCVHKCFTPILRILHTKRDAEMKI